MVTKEKKLAQVGELIEKLGLTGKEVVNYLNNLPQMNNIDISQIQVGMFWYEDDTFSFQRMVDKRIKAIVEWIGNGTVYGDLTASEIFDIKEECLNWFDARNYMERFFYPCGKNEKIVLYTLEEFFEDKRRYNPVKTAFLAIDKEYRSNRYWTVNELSFSKAFCFDYTRWECITQIKSDKLYVRPVLSLKVGEV